MAGERARTRKPEPPGEAERPALYRLVAELAGTFALTFVAAGADVAGSVSGGQVGPAARAVAPGLLVMAFVYALGDASGAHFNPAVSLGFALKRLFPVRWIPWYWAAQLLGAILAAAALRLLFAEAVSAGVSKPHVAPPSAMAIEAILTWLLLTVVLGTADRYRLIGPNAAIAVGATIAMCGLVALPIEGASMNPARSLGPALISGELNDVWIYIVGPLLGTGVAALLTMFLHGAEPTDNGQVEAARGESNGGQTSQRARGRRAPRRVPPNEATAREA